MATDMWTKRDIEYKAAPYGHITVIPAGTAVEPANNLPPDKDGRMGFWALPWDGMDEVAQGWVDSYGFHMEDDEVEPIPNIPTRRMLDISTAHLSVNDKYELERMALALRHETAHEALPTPMRVYDTHYGYVVYVNTAIGEVRQECIGQRYELSNTFWKTFQYAAANCCMLINYDCDAIPRSGLRTFEDDENE